MCGPGSTHPYIVPVFPTSPVKLNTCAKLVHTYPHLETKSSAHKGNGGFVFPRNTNPYSSNYMRRPVAAADCSAHSKQRLSAPDEFIHPGGLQCNGLLTYIRYSKSKLRHSRFVVVDVE